MNDIVIREARKSDLPAIGKLLGELVSAMDDKEGTDIGVAIKTCQRLLSVAGSHFLVAAIGGTPVGFINLTIRQTALHRSPSAMIDELVVAEEYRGEGIGNQLVLAAIDKCRRLGCCEVEVSTEKTNVKARKLYRKCGFNQRGILFEVDL
jgi:ribosomal protein S18 acetylase RimI-like enzyme